MHAYTPTQYAHMYTQHTLTHIHTCVYIHMHTYVHTQRAKHTPGYLGYFLPGLQFKKDGLYYSVAQLAIMIVR